MKYRPSPSKHRRLASLAPAFLSLLLLSSIVLPSVLSFFSASALEGRSLSQSSRDHAYLNALEHCYDTKYLPETVNTTSQEFRDSGGIPGIFISGQEEFPVSSLLKYSDGKLGWGCRTLLEGGDFGMVEGILEHFSKQSNTDDAKLKGLGYDAKSAKGATCYRYTVNFNSYSEGILTYVYPWDICHEEGKTEYFGVANGNPSKLEVYLGTEDPAPAMRSGDLFCLTATQADLGSFCVEDVSKESNKDFIEQLKSKIRLVFTSGHYANKSTNQDVVEYEVKSYTAASDENTTGEYALGSSAFKTAAKYLTGDDNYSKISNAEYFAQLLALLTAGKENSNSHLCEGTIHKYDQLNSGAQTLLDNAQYVLDINYVDGSGELKKTGKIEFKSDPSAKTVNYLKGDVSTLVQGATCKEVVEELNTIELTEEDLSVLVKEIDSIMDGSILNNTTSTDENASEKESDPCYDGAGPLGWVLCPVVSMLINVTDGLYSYIQNNFLSIRAEFFSGPESGDSSTGNDVYLAWTAIRDIANIVFIILLLVVIFSQITGVGIDNYGIKKILPRLIVTAVLVNLSYIICQLAVDISNIVGYGLNSFMESLGDQTVLGNPASFSPGGAQKFAVWSILGVSAVAAFLLSPGLVLTLVLALVSFAIAALFMWVVLVTRQAGVVIGVVISPLAFVCFLLPNTNKLFQRWLNLMKGLLLVFPLCALVVGGGRFVARIFGGLAGTGETANVGFALAAMALQVIPFFFIPTLLKGSLAGLGSIGAKIQGLSKSVSGKTTGAIQKSDAYGRANNFLGAKIGRGVGSTRTLNRRTAMKAREDRNNSVKYAKSWMSDSAVEAREAAFLSAQNKEALENDITLMAQDTDNYNPDTMERKLNELLSQETLSAAEQQRVKSLMKRLSMSGGEGNKKLTKSIRNATSAAGLGVAASFAQKDADVGKGIVGKDAHVSAYLRDYNKRVEDNKRAKNENRPQDERPLENFANRDTNGRVVSGWSTNPENMEVAAKNILTKDEDVLAQSGDSIRDTFSAVTKDKNGNTAPVFSDKRLQDMLDNEQLMSTADKDSLAILRQEVARRNASGSNIIEPPSTREIAQQQQEAQAQQHDIQRQTLDVLQSQQQQPQQSPRVFRIQRRPQQTSNSQSQTQQTGGPQSQQSPARPVDTRSIQAPVLQPTPPPSGEPHTLSNDELIDTITHPNSTQAAASRASEELRSRGIDPNTGGPVPNQPPES